MQATAVSRAITASLLLGASSMLNANTIQPSAEEMKQRVEIMEKAVVDSSVTALYQPEQRQQKLQLIDDARASLRQGNVKTAADQLERAARLLYPMESQDGIPLSSDKRRDWVAQMDQAIQALMPAARDIAIEKRVSTDLLTLSESLHQQGQAAASAGELARAERLLTDAYLALQNAVVELRSGDMLVIEQPDNGTENAWKEAVRRFEDWRITADWMQYSAEALGVDPSIIAQGSREADQIFQQARSNAQAGEWRQATELIDQAYLTMEDYWREAGMDI